MLSWHCQLLVGDYLLATSLTGATCTHDPLLQGQPDLVIEIPDCQGNSKAKAALELGEMYACTEITRPEHSLFVISGASPLAWLSQITLWALFMEV